MDWTREPDTSADGRVTVHLAGSVTGDDTSELARMVDELVGDHDLGEVVIDLTDAIVDLSDGGLMSVHELAARLRFFDVPLILRNPSPQLQPRLELLCALGDAILTDETGNPITPADPDVDRA